MSPEQIRSLSIRKDELWSFMHQVKNLPALLDQMQISGTREQMREFEKLMVVIREME